MGHFPEEAEKIQMPSYVQPARGMKALGVEGAEKRDTSKAGIKTCVLNILFPVSGPALCWVKGDSHNFARQFYFSPRNANKHK